MGGGWGTGRPGHAGTALQAVGAEPPLVAGAEPPAAVAVPAALGHARLLVRLVAQLAPHAVGGAPAVHRRLLLRLESSLERQTQMTSP